jgi:oligoendopeptidase F
MALPRAASDQPDDPAGAQAYVWDLSPLYASQSAWRQEFDQVRQDVTAIGRNTRALGRGPRALADGLDRVADLRIRAGRLALYGTLISLVDASAADARATYDAGTALEADTEAAVAVVDREIRTIGTRRLETWQRDEPRLRRHARRIRRTFELPGLSMQAGRLEAARLMRRWPQLAGDLYGALVSADLGWPPLPEETPLRRLSPETFLELRAAPQPRRALAIRSFDAKLGALEDAFALLLVRRIDADLTIARAQGFTSGIDALLASRDGLPAGSARVAIDAARAQARAARDYATLRARALGDRGFEYSSVWQSPPSITRRFSVTEANAITIAALSPLGVDYTTRLRARLRQPWRHLPPLPNKRPEYATFFPIGGVSPFTVMTFRGTYGNARALTGAAALMMMYADIPPDRAPDTRLDPAVLSNGAIYFGNILHDDYLLAQPLAPGQRIAYLIWALDRLWRQLFVNAVTMEFERTLEARVAAGTPPSGPEVSAIYLSILRHYYGSDAVGVDAAREWMTNDVAFATFEHHAAWAPAMAMACTLAEQLQAGNRPRVLAVLEGLRVGDSDLSHDILRRAAIDLTTSAPYDAGVRRMRALMRALEDALRER